MVAELDGLYTAGELRNVGSRLPRCREQLEAGAGDDAKRALATDEQLHHVVASDIFHHSATALALAPVAGYKSHANAVVAQSTVALPMRADHARRQQSADGRLLRQGWVSREKKAVFADHRGQVG